MPHRKCARLGAVLFALIPLGCGFIHPPVACAEPRLPPSLPGPQRPAIEIIQPFEGAVFPRDIAPPAFRWKLAAPGPEAPDCWRITIRLPDGSPLVAATVESTEWRPDAATWELLKRGSLEQPAQFMVTGFRQTTPAQALATAAVTFSTSADPVGAPIFYRDVNLPFVEAVKDPSDIKWRFGSVASGEPPPVMLANMPVCGNCHSFSRDGQVFGMDVDYANSKGSYVVTRTAAEMALAPEDIITWDEFRREDGELTFGLLSQVSPDGRWVVSTVKDKSVFAPAGRGKVLLTPEECREFTQEGKPFRFDLYRVPFNDGQGGRAVPLEGASGDGRSNFFPKYSPDGRWIVFCKAANYMLLQPDSELYLIPAAGGEARRLGGNLSRMNSWHSWSPNNRWLVFASKALSDHTQLFLTNHSPDGESAVPVLLDRFTATNRAANIPEFVNLPPDGIVRIREGFLNDCSFERAGNEFYRGGEPDRAIQKYRQALDLNPANVTAHQRLGFLLYHVKRQFAEGIQHTTEALKLDPQNGLARNDLGVALLNQGRASEAVRLDPSNADAHDPLALALACQGGTDDTVQHLRQAMALRAGVDSSVALHELLAENFSRAGRFEEAIGSAEHALRLARATGRNDLIERITARLARYEAARRRGS